MIKVTLTFNEGTKKVSYFFDRVQRFKDEIFAWKKNENIDKLLIAKTFNHEENASMNKVIYNDIYITDEFKEILQQSTTTEIHNNIFVFEIETL